MSLTTFWNESGRTCSTVRRPILWLSLIGCFACLGCGGKDWQAETYPASGRITINGEPPTGAIVELQSVGGKPDTRNSRPWAVVQSDGTYHMTTYEAGDGAPVGEYAVTIRWPPDVGQPSLADRLSGAYATPDRSEWKVRISEGDNTLPPIEIEGAKVQSGSPSTTPGPGPPGPAMKRTR